jgi:hypothetical protein
MDHPDRTQGEDPELHRYRSTPAPINNSFGCEDRQELEKWAVRRTELGFVGAAYESGPSFCDPGGIALEFVAPPARNREATSVGARWAPGYRTPD